MGACAFFGHGQIDCTRYMQQIESVITELIETKGVTQFYSGYRGRFEVACAEIVARLKLRYTNIINTMVLSYLSVKPFELPEIFDDSVYLLECRVPQRFAILETNKKIAEKSDFIVAFVMLHYGGAYKACCHALRKGKPIINLIEDFNFT